MACVTFCAFLSIILQIVRLQSAHLPGYNAALSSSLRDGPVRGQSTVFKSKAFENKKVLILHVYCHFFFVLWELTIFL